MKNLHLLAIATTLTFSTAALAQLTASNPGAKAGSHPTHLSQTAAMLPVPAQATSGADAATSPKSSTPYHAGSKQKNQAKQKTLTNREKLARFRAKNSDDASGTSSDPYHYDGWSASSVYANPADVQQ
jgi:uncharacterized iron-regulated membrane protein